MNETSRICLWCSATIPAGATACPNCGAHVEDAQGKEIPGVTEVDYTKRLEDEGRLPDVIDPSAWMSAGHDDPSTTEEALLPPSEAVRLEMRKMELEAEIENAGGSVMGPDDTARPVGMPSREALEAFDRGLLDQVGPAGESDLADRARELEQEENR
jgi:hypothetical protein